MTRQATKSTTSSSNGGAAPSALAAPPGGAFGLDGPWSTGYLTMHDEPRRQTIASLLAAARELRPRLRELQAQTEIDGTYPEDVHQAFVEHGFYRMLPPRDLGGLEIGVQGFYQVIAEVARGCPSTAWCLCLAAGHSLTLGSYWPAQAQQDIFGAHGYLVCPASGNSRDATLTPVDGGYRLSGTWRYASGAPYSTHFMPSFTASKDGTSPAEPLWAVVSRADFDVLDDWGGIIGMKGSGSNSIRVNDAFIPAEHVVSVNWADSCDGPTVGSTLHGNPVYAGAFVGFAEGEVAAVAVGLGMAALDEYERLIRTSKAPMVAGNLLRAEHNNWQRALGTAMGYADAAVALSARGGQLYEEFARLSHEGIEPFSAEKAMRLNGLYLVAEQLVWDTVELLLRTAGSTASTDGQALQRYFRDMIATRTRADQFEFYAADLAVTHMSAG